jgi:ankyrin repeat protein
VLLDAGADTTVRGKHGKTMLDIAHERGNNMVVNLLKSRGARE